MEHHKSMFRGLAYVFVGKVALHITTEVDCDSLFSQAGHAAQPNRNRTWVETFEQLVMSKHRMARIYCFPKKVKREFMKRKKDKDWNEKEERDDIMFWDQQKKLYMQENPTHAQMITELESDLGNKDEEGAMNLI